MVYKWLAEDSTMIQQKYLRWRQDLGDNFCDGVYEF